MKDRFAAKDGRRWQQCKGGLACSPRWSEKAMMKLSFLVEERHKGFGLGGSKATGCSRAGQWLWSLAK